MGDVKIFFDGWEYVIRIFIVGTLSFIMLVFLLRISGKRTLAQMSGFDFVITVAVGSTYGRLITASGVTLIESAAAFLLLVFLQNIFAYLNMRYGWFARITTSQPTILFYKGQFLNDNIRKCRVNKNEIIGVIRQQGIESMDMVEAVVLETSGGWSVVKKGDTIVGTEKSSLQAFAEKRESRKDQQE